MLRAARDLLVSKPNDMFILYCCTRFGYLVLPIKATFCWAIFGLPMCGNREDQMMPTEKHAVRGWKTLVFKHRKY